jgi:alkylation response protein AidB-like acyl-CoA dehydrogenase
VGGGFRLSGTWAFTSGCDHARLVVPLLGIGDGALADFLAMAAVRTTRGAVSAISDVCLDDNWFTMGLAYGSLARLGDFSGVA